MRIDHPKVRALHPVLPGSGHGRAYIVSPRLTRTSAPRSSATTSGPAFASLSTFSALSLAFLIWLCAVSINLTETLP